MATRAFIWLVVLVGMGGALLGGGAYALFGESETEPALAASGDVRGQGSPGQGEQTQSDDGPPADTLPDPSIGATDGDADGGGTSGGDGNRRGGGGFGGGTPIETISGTIASVTEEGVTLTTGAGPVEVPMSADTRIQLSFTGDEAGAALNMGDEIRAVLNRDADGNVVAQNIIVGGGGGRRAFGGDRQGGDGFNILAGTIASLGNNTFVMDTTEGSVEALLTDETSATVISTFAEASDNLAVGTEVTAIGRRSENGAFETIMLSEGAGFGGGFRLGGGPGDGGQDDGGLA
jgi:hypothetical protein